MLENKPPIRSTQEDVAELADELERFVIALAERIDAIQDAEMAACWPDVASLSRMLAKDADRLGYPGMAQSARSVAMSAEDNKTEALQDAIVELTELAQRIRRGHRGSA